MNVDTMAIDDHASKRTDPRYQRLMEATRAAARNGYDAVSMRDLAETCRISMTTIYQFCRSKDQLIAEAHIDNLVAVRERLTAHPPTGATPEERVLRVMRGYVQAMSDEDQLTRTLMRAMYAPGAHAARSTAAATSTYTSLVDLAIGDAEVPDRAAVIATLGHVIDSVVINWMSGRHDAAWAEHELDAAVHVLLSPR